MPVWPAMFDGGPIREQSGSAAFAHSDSKSPKPILRVDVRIQSRMTFECAMGGQKAKRLMLLERLVGSNTEGQV